MPVARHSRGFIAFNRVKSLHAWIACIGLHAERFTPGCASAERRAYHNIGTIASYTTVDGGARPGEGEVVGGHDMRRPRANVPPLVELLHAVRGTRLPYNFYKYSVLVLTFLCYTAFHAARKPPSIVKSVLRGNAEAGDGNAIAIDGWEPFNGDNGSSLLGQVDLAFLGAYALGMFFAGHLGDRVDLRYFLTIGAPCLLAVIDFVLFMFVPALFIVQRMENAMKHVPGMLIGRQIDVALMLIPTWSLRSSIAGMLGSGLFVGLFGMAFFWDTHNLRFFIMVQVSTLPTRCVALIIIFERVPTSARKK